MKVTAILPDELIRTVKELSGSKTITASLITALREWVSLQEVRRLTERVRKGPLRFRAGFSAERVRSLSRRR